MSVDKDKVNTILKDFQKILKKFKPNTVELQVINSKINQMTARNIQKQFHHSSSPPRPSSPDLKSSSPHKKWHKIKIE